MPLGQCKNWCLLLITIAFVVGQGQGRASAEGRGVGSSWDQGFGFTVECIPFPGVFYELLEVRMIHFQELLSCMGYIHLGHYSFILNVCSWWVISRRISLMMLVLQELLTRKEDLDGWFFVITKDVFIMHSNFLSYFYSVENYSLRIFFAYQTKILFFGGLNV